LGAWTYTDEQADVLGAGAEDAGGVYLLAQGRLGSDGPTAFARIGVSDGKTSPFSGGLQVGLALERLFPSRPESALALGLHAARLGGAFRESLRADSVNPAHYEWGLELTYSDAIARGVTLQPTLQAISNPGGDTDAGTLWVAGVRFTASFNED
jgi:porin